MISYTDCSPDDADLFTLGVGDALVIIDTETGGITRSYYFKDTYNITLTAMTLDPVIPIGICSMRQESGAS
jgi:hypothetical protein